MAGYVVYNGDLYVIYFKVVMDGLIFAVYQVAEIYKRETHLLYQLCKKNKSGISLKGLIQYKTAS